MTEEVIASGRYDLGLSLLTLAGDGRRTWTDEEPEPDLVEIMTGRG
ncbi:hypothetical protein [Jannaschia formosa]|nr:hypothetical protein [Jannaschia formosa]